MNVNENNFVKLLRRKNESAMEYVIKTYGGVMKAVIAKILYAYPQDAEECLSDCFIKIWEHIDSFDSKKCVFSGWACSIARYTALNRLKAIKRLAPTEDIDSLALADNTQITGDSEFDDFFAELISCLSEEDKVIFIRLFWQGYSVDEVAAEIGKSRNVIYNRISRGRKKIIKFNPGYFGREET